MSVEVHIIQGPLPAAPAARREHRGHGAAVCFEGIARPTENGRTIKGLDYEAYEPMATNMLRRIGDEMVEKHGLVGLCVEHSTGRVAVGECSFRLRIVSRHRKEALAAMDEFIDLLKRDVPIWKVAAC